ncbi:hypothetical protein FZEAL_4605 [Fusarium zealandicum]|uniref:Uncharacterized protein n=1 Tax=Fusarium zealandicum TaxID=1053134 RepID=A0A8H4XLQ0_9HYPO|nr:hypothetical protein FZEAL_4605 [Fusarium zealandicum]
MEESAPKRRRTSPRTSLNIGGTPPSPEPASPRRRRPSYASPTKASLARHNPDVLDRRNSRSPEKISDARPRIDAGVEQSPSELLAAHLARSQLVSDAPTPVRAEGSTPVSGRSSLRRVGGGMSAAARRTPSKINPRPEPAMGNDDDDFNPFRGKVLRRSPGAGGSMPTDAPSASMPEPELPPPPQASSPPDPPASMPEPALPPSLDGPASESEQGSPAPSELSSIAEPTELPEEPSIAEPALPKEPSPARSVSSSVITSPSEARSPTGSPPAPGPEPEDYSSDGPQPQPQPSSSPEPPPASMPEPEIPPLAQPDSQDEPPSASQPALRLPPSTHEATQRKSFRNSPIRWRELSQPKDSPLTKPPSRLFEKPRKSFPRARSPVKTTQDGSPAETVPEPRKPRLFDPDSAKKIERDALQKEIEGLRKDLETAQTENERIRLMQKSGRALAPSNQEALIDLLQRQQASTDVDSAKTVSQQLVKAALNPAALLPFGRASAPVPAVSSEDAHIGIKSHHPVSMTAEEELPYLELFSPFSISSNISILPETPEQPLRQLHAITFRSREIPGLFTARVDMIVNAADLAILDLNVVALEPSAKPELGPFVHKICTGDDCNRTMQRNIGILSWAMGEWLRLAVERAGLWCQLDKGLGSKDGVSEAASQMRARKSRRRKDDEEQDEESLLSQVESVDKVDLIRYMGQQYFDISIPQHDADEPGAVVRLEWKTEFDWTGEAQTKLAVMTGVPGKWHQSDERGSLGKIPKLFGQLVHGGESPEIAVRTIVALVAGEQS